MPEAIDLERVHQASRNNRHSVLRSNRCGCFSCESIYHSWEVSEFTEDDFSAVCPRCKIDSVLPDTLSEVHLSISLLRSMRLRYFENTAAA